MCHQFYGYLVNKNVLEYIEYIQIILYKTGDSIEII